jgi:hypothetical protein
MARHRNRLKSNFKRYSYVVHQRIMEIFTCPQKVVAFTDRYCDGYIGRTLASGC